jgi:hypothetical protein
MAHMIGFNHLGKLGRLGNQMFQFAALKGIARNNEYEYCIPSSKNQNEWEDHQLFVPFKMSNTTQLNVQYIDVDRPVISESGFSFDEKLYSQCPDWCSLFGFFQSEKYFKHIKSEIKGDFEFKDEIKIPCQEMISELKNPISLHIRRTDYITNSNHTVLNLSYYENALKEFDESSTVLVFSDDSDWCRTQSIFSDDRFLIAEKNSNYIDMCLMTLCKGHIIANSSFSWWGAWLSESEKIVSPFEWFTGSDNEHLDTKDLIPEEWVIL